MICPTCEALLQEHLDGLAAPTALERHLESCVECAGQRPVVLRLLAGVRLLRSPVPTADLADRIASRILLEGAPRLSTWRRRFAPTAVLAAAAAALLALSWWAWRPTPATPGQGEAPPVVAVQPAPLRDSMAEAQSAVVALTSRTASETVERTSSLLPLVAPTTLDPMAPMTTMLEPPLEPVREATSSVSAAVAPVADSARRAVGLFLRDLPGGSAPDKKPG